MCFFNFDIKMEADVVSMKCLSSSLQNVVPWKEIVSSPYCFASIFTGCKSFFHLVSWSCIWSKYIIYGLQKSGWRMNKLLSYVTNVEIM